MAEPRQLAGDLLGLVVTAFTPPQTAQRHGNNRIELRKGKLIKLSGEIVAQRKDLFVLQQANQSAGNAGVESPTAGTVIGRGMQTAGGTRLLRVDDMLAALRTTAERVGGYDRSKAGTADRDAPRVPYSVPTTSAGAWKKRREYLRRRVSEPCERECLASPTAEGIPSTCKIAPS